MRKYQHIWERIKEQGEAQLTADVSSHLRIINAVRKEKTNDLCWKILASESGSHFNLYNIIEDELITFYLVDLVLISYADSRLLNKLNIGLKQ